MKRPIVRCGGRLLALCLSVALGAAATPRVHRRLEDAPPVTQARLPHLRWFGGPVLANVKVVLVLWGPNVVNAQGLADYYTALVQSPAMDWLAEYSTPSQTIGRGTFGGSFIITPSVTTTLVTNVQLRAELAAQIAAGHLPAPDADTLYTVHLPPGVVISSGFNTSCQEYCAFHDTIASPPQDIFFSLVPDMGPGSGCDTGCGGSTAFESESLSASHELTEAVTDPEAGLATSLAPPLGWLDAVFTLDDGWAEIGDVCIGPGGLARVGGLVLQKEWSNELNACISTLDTAARAALTPPVIHLAAPAAFDFTLATLPPDAGPPPELALSGEALPDGVTLAFDKQSLTAGESATASFTLARGIPPRFDLLVIADGADATPWAAAHVIADDFTLALGAPSGILPAQGSVTVAVQLAPTPQSDPQPVTLSLQAVHPGVTAIFTPSAPLAGQPATMTLQAASGTPTGAFAAVIQGSTALFTHTATVPVVIAGDDYTVSLDPAEVAIPAGTSALVKVVTTLTHGREQPLTLSAGQLPPGLHAQFDPESMQSGSSAQLRLSADSNASTTPGQVLVVAAGPFQQSSASLRTTVTAAPGCTSAPVAWWALAGLLALRRRRVC